ncbi:HD domain-containing protein [Candidatus Uhrbacteria bacterium]|nr:HD domain-containing protein [Candidatus Uhrbacteria bacterium]
MIYSKLLHEAAETASRLHDGHYRRHPEGVAYFSHLAFTALLLQRAGYDDEVVAAGFLHDALEDTEFTAEQMTERFGARVTELVQGVSEQKDVADWVERKRLYREMIKAGSAEAAALSCADHIHNSRSLGISIKDGVDIKKIFKIGIDERFAHERHLVEIYKEKLAGSELAREFEASINDLEEIVKQYA